MRGLAMLSAFHSSHALARGTCSVLEYARCSGGNGAGRTLWCRKVDDITITFEHVDLLDGGDGLYVQLLEGGLELLVVRAAGLVDLLDLSSWSTLATTTGMSADMFCNDSHAPCSSASVMPKYMMVRRWQSVRSIL